MPSCTYCKSFREATIRKFLEGDRKYKVSQRYCRYEDAYVESTHKSCEHFVIAKYFWCKKNSYFMGVLACISRQKTLLEGCVRCRQGREIMSMSRGINLFALHSEKPKLLKRRKDKVPLTEEEKLIKQALEGDSDEEIEIKPPPPSPVLKLRS